MGDISRSGATCTIGTTAAPADATCGPSRAGSPNISSECGASVIVPLGAITVPGSSRDS